MWRYGTSPKIASEWQLGPRWPTHNICFCFCFGQSGSCDAATYIFIYIHVYIDIWWYIREQQHRKTLQCTSALGKVCARWKPSSRGPFQMFLGVTSTGNQRSSKSLLQVQHDSALLSCSAPLRNRLSILQWSRSGPMVVGCAKGYTTIIHNRHGRWTTSALKQELASMKLISSHRIL